MAKRSDPHSLECTHTRVHPFSSEIPDKILQTPKRQLSSKMYTTLLKQNRRILGIWTVQIKMFKNSLENLYDT